MNMARFSADHLRLACRSANQHFGRFIDLLGHCADTLYINKQHGVSKMFQTITHKQGGVIQIHNELILAYYKAMLLGKYSSLAAAKAAITRKHKKWQSINNFSSDALL